MSASPKKMTAAEQKAHDLKRNVALTEHKEDLDELLKRLGTNVEVGLSDAQVEELQAKWGPNMLTPPKETPLWIMFIKVRVISFPPSFIGPPVPRACFSLFFSVLSCLVLDPLLINGIVKMKELTPQRTHMTLT